MTQRLPYHIPGPAGAVISTTRQEVQPTPSTRPASNPSSVNFHFHHPAWQAMLHHLQAPPYGIQPVPSSLSLLRRNALSADFSKLRSLPVLLDSFSWVGKDAAVTLRDPTATMRATIHAEVFSARPREIEQGVVLLLDSVAALAYLSRPVGFRADIDASVHLSVQSTNVVRVFKGVFDKNLFVKQEKAVINSLDSYQQQAKKPPPVIRKRTRQMYGRGNSRPPLTPRNDHYRTLNTAEKTSSYAMPGGSTSRPPSSHSRPPYGRAYNNQQPNASPGRFERRSNYNTGFQPRGQPNHQQPGAQNVYQPQQHAQRYQRPFSVPRPSANQNPAQMNGSQQPLTPNKRPYVSPTTTGVRRTGMQPPTKKHASQATSTSPVAPAASTLTDDQLDTLLGEVDVDAIIAASQKVQQDNDAAQESGKDRVIPAEGNAAVVVRSDPQQVGSDSPHDEDNQGMNSVKPGIFVSGIQNGSTGTNPDPHVVDGNAGVNTGSKTFSSVDEAMIDSLFEGLDSSDFG